MERNGTSGVWTVLCTFEIIYLSLRGSRKRELPAVVDHIAQPDGQAVVHNTISSQLSTL